MSLWGSSNTGSQQEPKYLANTPAQHKNMFQRYGNVYADKSGWWLVQSVRSNVPKKELLVAIDRLSDKLGAPVMNEIWFSGTDNSGNVIYSANQAAKVNIAYTQQVQIKSATPPTFNLAATGATSGNVVATYSTGNSNNILQFTFNATADFGGLANANTYYVVNDQPLAALAAGILVGVANTSMNANTLIPTAANTKFPFTNRTPVARAWDPTAQITGIFFASSTVARNAASNVFVTFSKAVNVLTAALPNVTLNVATGNTTNAIYAAGNGTANLRFSWTGPQFVANVVTPAGLIQIKNGFINSVSGNSAANVLVTLAVATAAGNVTPT